ncbi:hypothetical protein FRUB_02616 [Fimbriiglobus ruber]|uniref:Uncharacterized protein n=1 Tax=Fimbriiglobus ruber TaxID=1908690 RepID=A0A225E3P6_9BACT|nr:hypothetical protein FRUB_02616 [Fimbriiglobus ruber]
MRLPVVGDCGGGLDPDSGQIRPADIRTIKNWICRRSSLSSSFRQGKLKKAIVILLDRIFEYVAPFAS